MAITTSLLSTSGRNAGYSQKSQSFENRPMLTSKFNFVADVILSSGTWILPNETELEIGISAAIKDPEENVFPLVLLTRHVATAEFIGDAPR